MSKYKSGHIIRALTSPTINLLLPYKYKHNSYISLNPKTIPCLPTTQPPSYHPSPPLRYAPCFGGRGNSHNIVYYMPIYLCLWTKTKTQKHIGFVCVCVQDVLSPIPRPQAGLN